MRDFKLTEWQRAEVESWARGKPKDYQGTLEIFTGGGKSLVGLACAESAARVKPELQLSIFVPTEALAQQWVEVVVRCTNVGRSEIGLLGAGGEDDPWFPAPDVPGHLQLVLADVSQERLKG